MLRRVRSAKRPVGGEIATPNDCWGAAIGTGSSDQVTTAYAMCRKTKRKPKSKRKIVYPFDGADQGSAPDDGFDSRIRNAAGGERPLPTYAICN